MRIAIVYGTRPEIIKLVPLILKMQAQNGIELTLINTGQHREMVGEIEKLFGITPDYSLDIMQHNQTLTDILQNVARTVEPVLKTVNPDIVLLQGDTSTVATVGTICFYNKIPVGHVEAGLRSYNLDEPFPEEFNRRIISIMAKFNFAPTLQSAENLLKEGVAADKIIVTGNTVVDMVELAKMKLIHTGNQHNGKSPKKILITAHRRENHGEGILNICAAVKQMNRDFPDLHFIWPVHPNPNVKSVIYQELEGLNNVVLSAPLNYMELIKALDESFLVWSDSGGIQEECPSFRKPVLILRNVTERPEVVTSGFGELVGTDTGLIVRKSSTLLSDPKVYESMTTGTNPFGDGTASLKIISTIVEYFNAR
jgi:UDP-N-acetylglucosamine 2-epimerase (non-hydrolysing)